MAARIYSFDSHSGTITTPSGDRYSPSRLAKMIANCLMRGEEVTPLGVTVNYVIQMFRIIGRTGEFSDNLHGSTERGCHAFDPNTPTVGDVEKRRALRAAAKTLRDTLVPIIVFDPELFPSAQGGVIGLGVLNAEAVARECDARVEQLTPGSDRTIRPLAHRYVLPKERFADTNNGAVAVWFEQSNECFCFGDCEMSQSEVARTIVLSLLMGQEKVTLGGIGLTVNYLVEMLRDTGRMGGEFIDFVDDVFDSNVPTPDDCLVAAREQPTPVYNVG